MSNVPEDGGAETHAEFDREVRALVDTIRRTTEILVAMGAGAVFVVTVADSPDASGKIVAVVHFADSVPREHRHHVTSRAMMVLDSALAQEGIVRAPIVAPSPLYDLTEPPPQEQGTRPNVEPVV